MLAMRLRLRSAQVSDRRGLRVPPEPHQPCPDQPGRRGLQARREIQARPVRLLPFLGLPGLKAPRVPKEMLDPREVREPQVRRAILGLPEVRGLREVKA